MVKSDPDARLLTKLVTAQLSDAVGADHDTILPHDDGSEETEMFAGQPVI